VIGKGGAMHILSGL